MGLKPSLKTSDLIRVAIAGGAGRMGQALIKACHLSKDAQLTSISVREQHPMARMDAGFIAGLATPLSVFPVNDLSHAINDFDVLIDFTTPKSTLMHIDLCIKHKKSIVIGTTGFNHEQQRSIQNSAQQTAIVFSPNYSIGIQLCLDLLKKATQVLGDEADIEIVDMHHRNKVDAPSGTALRMGEVIAQTLNRDLNDCAVYGRQGYTGVRDKKTIGFETIRGGDVIGDHTVMFACEGERLEISHKAQSRLTFAKGAVRAALWLTQQSTGLYDMQDVLADHTA